MLRRKLVVVGDGAAGKTSLLVAYKDRRFAGEYVPTVFENSRASVRVEDRTVDLALWDTAGQEDYDRLRPLSYPSTHVVLVCFAVDSLESLLNVQRKWAHELREYIPAVPIILVGCKADLRSTAQPSDMVAPPLAHSMAERIGAVSYVECSAKTLENVDAVFAQAARASLAVAETTTSHSALAKNRSRDSLASRRCSLC